MVYGCRRVDDVFERSISVDALAAGEYFMVRFSAKSKDRIGNHEGSHLVIGRFAHPTS